LQPAVDHGAVRRGSALTRPVAPSAHQRHQVQRATARLRRQAAREPVSQPAARFCHSPDAHRSVLALLDRPGCLRLWLNGPGPGAHGHVRADQREPGGRDARQPRRRPARAPHPPRPAGRRGGQPHRPGLQPLAAQVRLEAGAQPRVSHAPPRKTPPLAQGDNFTLLPHTFAVFRYVVQAPAVKAVYSGWLNFTTNYELVPFPVKFTVTEGSLVSLPAKIVITDAFPVQHDRALGTAPLQTACLGQDIDARAARLQHLPERDARLAPVHDQQRPALRLRGFREWQKSAHQGQGGVAGELRTGALRISSVLVSLRPGRSVASTSCPWRPACTTATSACRWTARVSVRLYQAPSLTALLRLSFRRLRLDPGGQAAARPARGRLRALLQAQVPLEPDGCQGRAHVTKFYVAAATRSPSLPYTPA